MPIFRYPFFYNRNYPNYYYNRYNFPHTNNTNLNTDTQIPNNDLHKTQPIQSEENNTYQEEKKSNDTNSSTYFFEIFGLKLYFDDILLICLIFFLYQEGVKDDELFISLVLLLLS